MGYYQAGDYYRAGDGNYAAGGLFSFIGKAAKTVLGLTPVGRAVQAVVPALANPPVIKGLAPQQLVPTPGFGGTVSRILPGGDTGYMVARRRRMNPLNVRALRRAGRRLKGFLKIAGRLGALPVNRGKGKRVFKRKAR